MPRGGGFRGGGFRGGGFRGGGFRGGGFRGGGFRGGGFRGGRPFGRTGATRIVSRSPRGPYTHRYYSPHRRFYRPYWWYHRPWYWRWWYSPWWAGYWYRPWYYSPVYVGGGILFMIVLALIILPAAGVAFWFPFSNADSGGYVNYSSTETLYPNDLWYESEYIENGKDITFSVTSSSSDMTFAIWDHSYNSLPTTEENIDIVFSTPILISGQYWYEWLYLKPDSLIEYDFNASGPIDFFIADGNEYDIWYNWGPDPSFYIQDTVQNNGTFGISAPDIYYVVWYNDGVSPVDVDYTLNYTSTYVVDFSGTYETQEGVNSHSGTFQVNHSGTWYFFIYFIPTNTESESMGIEFDVTYDTGVTYVDRWIGVQWILIIVLVVVVIIIIAAVVARRGQKKLKLKEPTTPAPKKPSPYKITPSEVEEKVINCTRCNASIKPDAKFCPNCGGKIEGRQVGVPSITTPATAKTCSLCGSKLTGTESYCKWCGTKIEK
ncbi:MAG: zinc ribbon domain-containing protein [Promethearchaeota archaeon]